MKTILAIGAAAAVFAAMAGSANAQDCVNGYKMMKDQIPVRCDALAPAFAGPAEEPLITGSIAPPPAEGTVTGVASEQPPRAGGPQTFAESRETCLPGQYYMLELNSGNRAVRC